MERIYWDKIRILITNKCNYRCPFCHNEGQSKDSIKDNMTFGDFKKFVDILKNLPLSEINLSGGEPFLNKEATNMILYLCNEFTCDISCATNLSLITEDDIKRLSGSRVKFNIQFPYVTDELFQQSTGNGRLSDILAKIETMKANGISVGLNTVVQSDDFDKYEKIILFAIDNELPLKLLPQLGNAESIQYKEFIYPILKKYVVEYKDKMSGATRWVLSRNGNTTTVLYIDFPCFYNDIYQCRNYGELRILSNFYAQPCINKPAGVFLRIHEEPEIVVNQLHELWKNFTKC